VGVFHFTPLDFSMQLLFSREKMGDMDETVDNFTNFQFFIFNF